MKILVLSNLYPPHFIGGYELGCARVADALQARGHDVRVLTSTYGTDAAQTPPGDSTASSGAHVSRQLAHSIGVPVARGVLGPLAPVLRDLSIDRANRRSLRAALHSFRPDLVYVWNAAGVSVSLGLHARAAGYPVVHYVSDYWPVYADSWYRFSRSVSARRGVNRALRFIPPALRAAGCIPCAAHDTLGRVQVTSAFVGETLERDATLRADGYEVIHWGVPIPPSDAGRSRSIAESATSLLVGGRIEPGKAIDVPLRAILALARSGRVPQTFRVTVAGPIQDDDYGRRVRRVAEELAGLVRVDLPGKLAPDQLQLALRSHDLFALPSVWQEPFSIFLVEAMACGMAPIAARTGGTPEIVQHDSNGLLVPPGDVDACAAAIDSLISDPARFRRIAHSARDTVLSQFTLDHMVTRIERSLEATLDAFSRRA